jgi:7-cyano-7-deazaguanine synthase
MKKAIVLLSGGLDSTTCLAIAKHQGFTCYALSFQYGQKHSAELMAAKKIAQAFAVATHHIMPLDLTAISSSAVTDETIAVPDYTGSHTIPVTYVPARNTVFLSIALGWAEVIAAEAIFIGVSAVDYSGYPDCRPDYIAAYQHMANLATKAGVEGKKIQIETPLLHLSKAETIRQGMNLGVDYAMTISCYRADETGVACGRCDSCALRKKGFMDGGFSDPTRYQ